MTEIIKLYCVFSQDAVKKMNGSRGKLAAQAGHGYLHAVWDAVDRFPDRVRDYRNSSHAFKIALVVPSEDELLKLEEAYRPVCGVSLVKDAGFTVFKEPTVTCLGIGPILVSEIGDDLKSLELLK